MAHAIASAARANPRLVSEITEGHMKKTEFTVDDFANQIRAMRAGSTVRRDAEELRLPILIGQTPAEAAVPATRPGP